MTELYIECKKVGHNLDPFLKEISLLSAYYFKSRYPDSYDPDLEKRSVASEALGMAKKLRREIKKHF